MVICSSIISVEKTSRFNFFRGHFWFLLSIEVMNDCSGVWNSCIFNIGLFQPRKGLYFPIRTAIFLLVVSLIMQMNEFAFSPFCEEMSVSKLSATASTKCST